MLRKHLRLQIVALATSAAIAGSLTAWSGLSTQRAATARAEIDEITVAAQELEINIHEQSFALLRYLTEADPALLKLMEGDAQTAAQALERLRRAEHVLEPAVLADLEREFKRHTDLLTQLVNIARRKQGLLAQVVTATHRLDALLSEKQIPMETQRLAPRMRLVANMEIQLAKGMRELGLYLRTSHEEHRLDFEQHFTRYGDWEGAYRKSITSSVESAWLDAVSAEAVRTAAGARELGALASRKFATVEQLTQAEATLDQILDDRLQRRLDMQHRASLKLQNRAFTAVAGSVFLLLLVTGTAILLMRGVRRRLQTGLKPLLTLSERIGAGDFTSAVEPALAADEFQTVAEGFLQMRRQLRENTVSLDRLDSILDRLGSLRIVVGADGTIREVSPAVAKAVGYSAFQLEGGSISRVLGQEMDFHTLRQLIRQGLLHQQTWALNDSTGTSLPVVMTGLELTEESLLLLGTPSASGLSHGVWSHLGEGLVLLDAGGMIRRANPAALVMLHTDEAAIRSRTLAEVCEQAGCQRWMDAEFLGDLARRSDTVELSLTPDGRSITQLQAKVTRLEATETQPDQLALILRDVTELHRAQEEVRRLAYVDPLTGLVNRRRLQQTLTEAIRAAVRRGERLALLFLDLDGFKDVNDSLGHQQGDRFLQEVARRLQCEIREADVAARLGGDEFCLLLLDVDDEGRTAAEVAQRCLESLTQPFVLEGNTISGRGSIGIAVYPADAAEANGLLKAADTAMYAAKNAGKHRFAFYDAGMTQAVERRLAMEAALRQALRLGEFELHYQPKVSLVTGRMCGVEALVRWRRPGFGMVAPDEFISVAEQIGLIGALGNWVLEAACCQVATWHREGLEGLELAVNISPSHFQVAGFIDIVARLVQKSGITPGLLEIEVTESITRNPQQHGDVCLALQRLGVRVAIDDFGTGYSSLSVLQHMPINTLKLDRQFIQGVDLDGTSAVMTGTIIGLAAGLNFSVVAEGVETLEQVQVLTGLGCKMAQGYYFSRPVQPEEIPMLAQVNFLRGATDTAVAKLALVGGAK